MPAIVGRMAGPWRGGGVVEIGTSKLWRRYTKDGGSDFGQEKMEA